jgi:hypothetical protein
VEREFHPLKAGDYDRIEPRCPLLIIYIVDLSIFNANYQEIRLVVENDYHKMLLAYIDCRKVGGSRAHRAMRYPLQKEIDKEIQSANG